MFPSRRKVGEFRADQSNEVHGTPGQDGGGSRDETSVSCKAPAGAGSDTRARAEDKINSPDLLVLLGKPDSRGLPSNGPGVLANQLLNRVWLMWSSEPIWFWGWMKLIKK
jgi:hypothetical protein